MNHELKYRAATQGLTAAGVPDNDAHWYCSCYEWRFAARPKVHRPTGNNLDEAKRAHNIHAEAHRLIDADLADNYGEALKLVRTLHN